MAKIRELWYSIPLRWRDVVVRSAKTFVATFLSIIVPALATVHDQATAWAVAMSALSAALTAVWNTWKTPSSGETQLVPVIVYKNSDDILPGE